MINRVLIVGLLAGLCAGLFVTVLQHFSATRLIIAAESYETTGKTAFAGDVLVRPVAIPAQHTDAGPHGHAHEAEEWKPENGFQRTAFTALATTVTGVSFALMLLAAMLATGETITPHRALAYGAAAFLAVGLAPAAGLAPELPGSGAASLGARQAWWFATVLCSLTALWLIIKGRAGWQSLLGLVLLLAPHIVGAPHPAALESKVPAELAASFAAQSLALQAVLWIATGYAAGYFWQRFDRPGTA